MLLVTSVLDDEAEVSRCPVNKPTHNRRLDVDDECDELMVQARQFTCYRESTLEVILITLNP